MIRELIFFLMEMFIQDNMLMVSLKEKEFINGKMEVFMLENSKKV